MLQAGTLDRSAEGLRLGTAMGQEGAGDLLRNRMVREHAAELSLSRFGIKGEAGNMPADAVKAATQAAPASGAAALVYRRNGKLKGPMNGFGYSWFDDHIQKAGWPRPALLSRSPAWPEGPSFGYEALNLVDGRRTVQQIRNDLAATVGPAPVEEVAQYLETLARLGVIEPAR
jgi:hypothetical protein